MRNIWKDGIFGVVTGDALGCPVEFLSRDEIAARPNGHVTGMEGFGSFNLPAGSWTDDSSMTLATLDSLFALKRLNTADIMNRFSQWLYEGIYTPHGKTFDVGMTCANAIDNYRKNGDVKRCGKTGERANGNGSLMRIMPAVLYSYLCQKRNKLCDAAAIEIVDSVSRLTHDHERARMACGIYFFAARAILDRENDAALTDCLQRGIDEAFAFYKGSSQLSYYARLTSLKDLARVPEADIRGTGYVVECLEASIWSLIRTASYEEAALCAVNLGDDTDTTAAITGGLAGLYYGYDNIPQDWLKTIALNDEIEKMCEDTNALFNRILPAKVLESTPDQAYNKAQEAIMMIEIRIQSIVKANTEAVVNAANPFLMPGGGVCGAIFEAAGYDRLQEACSKIGKCETGKAVITPGFDLKAKYIIHAVGPQWEGGKHDEAKLLYSAYRKALHQARVNECRSIAFPLISAGIYGYPAREAWQVALKACSEYLSKHPEYTPDIIFCSLDSDIAEIGKEELKKIAAPTPVHEKTTSEVSASDILCFLSEKDENGYLSNWYPAPFTIEGIRYAHVEQYMMAKKALLFKDIEHYFLIMNTDDPMACKAYGRQVSGFDSAKWSKCSSEVVYHALSAKFKQNDAIKAKLIATGNKQLAEANPNDKIWGIALKADDPNAADPSKWQGENRLGTLLMKVRGKLK